MFNSSNYIAPFQNSDTALVFVNDAGQRIHGINVCKYLNSGVEDTILWVLLEGGAKLEFGFETADDASNATIVLINAINLLQANCELGGGNSPSPDPIPSPISISYDNYKTLINNNETVPLQYYDIIDSNNALGKGFGVVYRCVALNTADAYPQGIVLTTGDKVIIDCNVNKIVDQAIIEKNIVALNNSLVSADEYSNYIFATNNSYVTVSITDFIHADNANITASDCQNISATNATITINNSTNCSFKDVVVNLTGLGIFNNIEVSNNSTGKEGYSSLDIADIDNTVLLAYRDTKTQKLSGTLGGNTNLILRNLPTVDPINAEFELIIDPATILLNYTITVKDYISNATLLTISSANIGTTLVFKYDIELNKFVVYNSNSTANQTKTKITISSNNQVLFTNALNFIPQNPDLSLLTVNGVIQEYEVDYTISNKNVNWISTDFNLETTDVVYIIYK